MNESVEIMKRSVLQELLANSQHANKYQAVQIVATNANPNSAIPAYRNWYYLDTRYPTELENLIHYFYNMQLVYSPQVVKQELDAVVKKHGLKEIIYDKKANTYLSQEELDKLKKFLEIML